jgi:sarcosine oxidase delta subunit
MVESGRKRELDTVPNSDKHITRRAWAGVFVTEYRRGIERGVWQERWHFEEGCKNYPTTNFAIGHERPPSNELCEHCLATSKRR